jgi:uncharacterized protein (DUF697 family)
MPEAALQEAIRRARKLLKRRAIIAAAASAVPVPGLDWIVDAAMMSKLIPDINEEFGLTPQQIDLLPPAKREQVQKALAVVGSVMVGRFVTRDLLVRMAKMVGKRLTVQQAAKFVPIAGQAVSAALGYSAVRYLGEQHIKDCVRVVEEAQLTLPGPTPTPPPKPAPEPAPVRSLRRSRAA